MKDMDQIAPETKVGESFLRTAYAGSHYQMGYQMGPSLATVKLPPFDNRLHRFAASCEALLSEVYPPLVERVEGMIEGGNLDGQAFKAYFYGRGGPAEIGCTNFAVLPAASRYGRMIVGGNYDWYYQARIWREVRAFRPQGVYSHLQVTHHWAGSPDAINDQGMIVLLAALPGIEPRNGPGLQWHMVIDILLETCKDAQEARRLVTQLPHLRGFNYLVADAQGRAFNAEATPQGVVIREPEDGILVATNHLPGSELLEEVLEERAIQIQRLSIQRFRRAEEMLRARADQIDLAYAQEVLRDHEGLICRGEHPSLPDLGGFHVFFGTIWSLVSQPQEKALYLAPGHPCLAQYELIDFEGMRQN